METPWKAEPSSKGVSICKTGNSDENKRLGSIGRTSSSMTPQWEAHWGMRCGHLQSKEKNEEGREEWQKKNNPPFVGILAKSGLWSLGIRHLRSVWFNPENLSTEEPDCIWRNIAWHPIPTSYLNSLYLHVFIWKLGLLVLVELSWDSNEFIYVKRSSARLSVTAISPLPLWSYFTVSGEQEVQGEEAAAPLALTPPSCRSCHCVAC